MSIADYVIKVRDSVGGSVGAFFQKLSENYAKSFGFYSYDKKDDSFSQASDSQASENNVYENGVDQAYTSRLRNE